MKLLQVLLVMVVVVVGKAAAAGMVLFLWGPKHMRLLLTILMVLWLSGESEGNPCTAIFPRDALEAPLSLPVAIRLKPTTTPKWRSHWELVGAEGKPVVCLLMESNATSTIVRSAATSCKNLTQDSWENTVIWPPLDRGSGVWENLYTIFLSATEDAVTIQLNQQEETGLTQITNGTKATAVDRVNATIRGPLVQLFSNLERINGCTIMEGCTNRNGWIYLSVSPSDAILLLPDPSADQIEVKVSLSNCFPEYKLGMYNTSSLMSEVRDCKRSLPSSSSREGTVLEELLVNLEVSYSRSDRYHTLIARIDSQIILLETVQHQGLDCSGEWYMVGVAGARVTPNCYASRRSCPEALPQSSYSHSAMLVSIPIVILSQMVLLFVFW